ncbi:Protein PIEZO2 [Anopheles sinensis]|uniref:Protein PIEZO2 n=1 Tax=Anopheles sinensis TaxID=74873 RepID=A0A084W9G8_ANOSI|nr:Protein PIEZO2 [Anopheles sinensis]
MVPKTEAEKKAPPLEWWSVDYGHPTRERNRGSKRSTNAIIMPHRVTRIRGDVQMGQQSFKRS